ncbi:hypothetical protein P43SY_005395 [Pythium insidiosum]|uniref:Uncharacterized protein n=1 Tax=Pythium insidiosum TaxID=114742 RepID=A0AAD5M6G0_PYTIN|nr:hypothetical protein P43SY_005395 [Pythium insidiosum]
MGDFHNRETTKLLTNVRLGRHPALARKRETATVYAAADVIPLHGQPAISLSGRGVSPKRVLAIWGVVCTLFVALLALSYVAAVAMKEENWETRTNANDTGKGRKNGKRRSLDGPQHVQQEYEASDGRAEARHPMAHGQDRHRRDSSKRDGIYSPTLRSTQSAVQLRESATTDGAVENMTRSNLFGELNTMEIEAVEVEELDDDDTSDSASSSAPSSPSATREDDSFETWLHEAQAASMQQAPVIQYLGTDSRGSFSAVPDSLGVTDDRTASFSQELAEWLRRERSTSQSSSSVDLARSVQQIEEDIRLALDSAASRVAEELHRRNLFEQELRSVGARQVDVVAPHWEDRPALTSSTEHTIESTPDEATDLLLLMDVVIGDGRSETIEVRVGDHPESLATAFATKHGLAAESIPRLTEHIQEQLDALAAEMAEDEQQQHLHTHLPSHERDSETRQPLRAPEQAPHPHDNLERSASMVDDAAAIPLRPVHQLTSPQTSERQQREFEREHKYNTLMERYGHYTSHSGKVNPSTGGAAPTMPASGSSKNVSPTEPLTLRNIELAERTRLTFGQKQTSGGDRDHAKNDSSVFNRLYALAESREKWIRRQQKAKRAEEMKEQESLSKLELAAKSKHLVAHRTNGGYAHIGERLYEEALAEMAKRDRDQERRALEREQQLDWTCAKCAFVNQYNDDVCKNMVSTTGTDSKSGRSKRGNSMRGGSTGTVSFTTPETLANEAICGHPRPDQLFRPTLLTAPPGVARALKQHKQRTGKAASQRRERSQKAMEDEFRETCPFRPKINEVSEEIMREKLELEAKIAGVEVAVTRSGDVRRKNPFQALYEDAFHAKAQREAREEAYLKQFPFKPNIGVNALWSSADGSNSIDDVVHRLAVERYQELELKRQSLQEKYAPDRDPVTGREYFKPETGRAPVFNRNERGLPIGDFLYEAHKEHEDYHRRLHQQALHQMKAQRQQCFLSDASKQALEARKKKTFGRIFDFLRRLSRPRQEDEGRSSDGDYAEAENPPDDPRVIPRDVVIEELPAEIANIVSIAFEFASHQPFSRAEFEGYMEKLMAEVPGLTYTQMLFLTENLPDGRSARRSVYDKTPAVSEPEIELTFRPTIDKNSDHLARKHGRADKAKVFYALNQYFEHYKDRKEQARKLLEREFARQHPFQPTFFTKNRKSRGAAFYEKLRQEHNETSQSTTRPQNERNSHCTPVLRTAVPNARPYVRPIDSEDTVSPSGVSRSDSFASSKQFVDDEDAALTSHVLAALDERSSVAVPSSPIASTQTSPAHTRQRLRRLTPQIAWRNDSALITKRHMSRPSGRRLVLYTLVGEPVEPQGESKHAVPDKAPNAFALPRDGDVVRLADVQRAFPLGGAFHFAFKNAVGAFVDLTNPSAVVPCWDNKIVARVTPLLETPEIKLVGDADVTQRPEEAERSEVRSQARTASREEVRSRYEEYQTFIEDDSDDMDHDRDRRSERHGDGGWREQRAPSDERRFDDGQRTGAPLGGQGAGNADWLRKQTEQAYDFAKKISMEDAKKGASETAKKAKKWGASLLSSAKASLANAAGAIKSVKHLNLMPLIEFGEARVQHQEVCRVVD